MPDCGYRQCLMDALSIYKALADDTRFAIYQELSQTPSSW
jgi:hypothetical protein